MKKLVLVILISSIFLSSIVMAQQYVDVVLTQTTPKYSTSDYSTSKKCFESDCYDNIEIKDYGSICREGEPIVPYKNILVVIPPNADVTSVTEVSKQQKVIPGEYDIQPCPPPQHLYSENITKPEKNKTIYEKNEYYPTVIYELKGTYFYKGYKIVVIGFYPMQYNPVTKKILKTDSLNLRVNYKETGVKPQSKTEIDPDVKNLVYNYDQAFSNGWSKKIEMTTPPLVCGNGICEPNENCTICSNDCGICPKPEMKIENVNIIYIIAFSTVVIIIALYIIMRRRKFKTKNQYQYYFNRET